MDTFQLLLAIIWKAVTTLKTDFKPKVRNIDRKKVFSSALVSIIKSNFFTYEKEVKVEYSK